MSFLLYMCVCVASPVVTLGWKLEQSHSDVINSLLSETPTGSLSEITLQ